MRSGPRGHTSPGSPSDTAFLSGCVGRMSVTSSSTTVAVLRLSIRPGYASAGFGTRVGDTRRWNASRVCTKDVLQVFLARGGIFRELARESKKKGGARLMSMKYMSINNELTN